MKISKFLTYVVKAFASLKELAEAVNRAESPEELDELVCGGAADDR